MNSPQFKMGAASVGANSQQEKISRKRGIIFIVLRAIFLYGQGG
jgi:hypothetical protein